MGLFRDLQLGEKVNISGNRISLDMVIENIRGQDNTHREAVIGFIGTKNNHITLSYRDGLCKICDGVFIGVREYCAYSYHGKREVVPIHFSLSPLYRLRRYDNV
ncbi:MAG: hypothetical protein AABX72_04120 [Nanoarchaeota archaeon]